MVQLAKLKDNVKTFTAKILAGVLSLAGKAYPIKIGRLNYDRGHLLVNTEFWLRTKAKNARGLHLFISGTKPFNRQILTMFKRKICIWENDFAIRLLDAFQRRAPDSDIWIDLKDSGHFHWEEWNSVPPQIALNEGEKERGRELLKKMGIGKNEPMVCFCARDDRFLKERIKGHDWDYHRYRNTNIENYLKAMEWLTTKGYWALRMGALVDRPLRSSIPRIMDYASVCRSDFMDVFLFSHCKFYVGDSAGAICFPNTFNTPVVFVNSVPLSFLARNKNALTIPKKCMDKRTGRILGFREIFDKGMDMWLSAKDYDEAGIETIENTPQEITDVVMEMHLRLEGQWEPASEDERLQQRFRAAIPDGHRLKGFVSRIGTAFLRNNQDLLK